MTQTLTQQQIAEMKAQSENNWLDAIKIIQRERDEAISLIATLEARDAAFDEMLAALKALLETIKETQDAGYIKETEENESVIAARSAIAHAEKVKKVK